MRSLRLGGPRLRYQDKVRRRSFLSVSGMSVTAAVVGFRTPKVLLSAGKPQKFIAGYAPFTRGSVE